MLNGNSQTSNQGFILLGMLCLLVISGYILTQASAGWSDVVRREREQGLILRVFNRYAAVLYAEDMLGLTKATHKSIQGGTRTNIDVLNAESQLFEAKGDLLLARYNYLQSYLNLKKVTGTLGLEDLQLVAARFQN